MCALRTSHALFALKENLKWWVAKSAVFLYVKSASINTISDKRLFQIQVG
jgi:hypothetical protein